MRFTYDAYGRRLTKTYTYDPGDDYSGDFLIGSATTYNYDNSGRLIREFCTEEYTESASTNYELTYLYDESGVVGFLYRANGGIFTPYYYHRNLQGDVISIHTVTGTKCVEYAYDAYGNCETVYTTNTVIADNNPIRYRGYYYDRETGLYYLKARYYNPEWRRFISPDSTAYLDPESVNGLNLYCYCGNDPVDYCDPSGHSATLTAILIGLGIGAALGLGAAAYSDYNDDEYINGSVGWQTYLGYSLIGGALGFGAGYFWPSISAFLGTSFSIPISAFGTINAGGALALTGATSITFTGAELVFGGALIAADIGLIYYAYESKKAAPRIRSNTKKQAYDKAFLKGGKKKPTLHKNGKYGPHFHPANPKYKHWHYYFSFLFVILGIDSHSFD